jgi:glucose-1-phosphate cytidylyltransferase
MRPDATPVVILCGGKGIYVDESGRRRSKALVEVNGEPMVAHVMRAYLAAGFRSFVLAAGYQGEQLAITLSSRYGAGRAGDAQPFEVELRGRACEVRVVDTGLDSMTGERINRVRPYLAGADTFAVTYSDTISTVDLAKLGAAHERHGRAATILGVRAPTRFRILGLRPGDPQVRGFAAKPVIQNDFVNGGFYLIDRAVLEEQLLPEREGVVLEETMLEALAAAGELVAYPFEGDWHYLDCERDLRRLEEIAAAYE